MATDDVIVPPEVYDGLAALDEDGDLDPEDREATTEAAAERGYEATVDWLEQVGDEVYDAAARGGYTAQGKE